MRRILVPLLCAALAGPAAGQTPGQPAAQDQTLADIRQELAVVFVELQKLKRELVTTGAPGTPVVGATTLDRVNALEAELTRLTAQTEDLQNRINQVVTDGTNRIGDLEFRVCELDPGCKIGEVGATLPIGGAAGAPAPAAPPPPSTGGVQLAATERADFDAAKAAFDAGQFAEAASLFATFAETYTGGPLTAQAQFWRGRALEQQGDAEGAARAYLASFSGSPQGEQAPEALLRLGLTLDKVGQKQDACLTLGEVTNRFPDAPASLEAQTALASLGC